jgi:aminopeptidase N
MKRTLACALFILALVLRSVAQQLDPLAASYASADNPHYWKNKKPHAAYWQQDVHYRMQLELNENSDILSGKETVYYVNNSPDTLHFVYFHLYQNAFQPNSYYDQLLKSNSSEYPYGPYQQQGLGTKVESIQSGGIALKTENDNTMMKAWLAEPLLPGGVVKFDISFKTWFDIGAPWGRMRVYEWYGNKHYNGAHFYPRIAVYDYRSGWDTDQHLGHEFYGDFGTYSVSLSLADNFIVDATGTLTNRQEAMPDELRKKLDISNFKDKPLDSEPSVIIPYDSTRRKTWKFEAMNVHDFAFLADPTYRIGEVEWNGIKCVALVSEPHAAKWQDAAQITSEIIRIYSEDFGMYAYPKIIVSDAQSGMEYPMLTMDGNLSPDYTYLFAHEVGHNWFFGMVGNNETYQAALDEGFTQFLTIRALEKLGKTRKLHSPDPSGLIERNLRRDPIRYESAYDSYIENALTSAGVTLNTHSDMFLTRQGYGQEYRQVYNKTAVMLFNLQYTLGDELFASTIKEYFRRWSFCHPYLDDFRLTVNQYTNTNLNWFFDQWLETTKTIDYSIRSVEKVKGKGNYVLKFHRRGMMQMPLDFTVTCRDDSVYEYHIPNTDFVKKTRATVLPKWTGWNRYNRSYDVSIHVSDKIRNVVIDSSRRLADLNLYNNSHRRPITANFDFMFEQPADWERYEFYGRPDIWYNGYDGLKVGFHLDGGYMKYQHCFELAAWINTRLFQQDIDESMYPYGYNRFSFRLKYRTPIRWLSQKTWLDFSGRSLDGVNMFHLGIEKYNRKGNGMIGIGMKSMFLFGERSLTYLMYPNEWSYLKEGGTINYNNIVYGKVHYTYEKNTGLGAFDFLIRSSAFGNGYDFATVAFTQTHRQKMWRFFLNTRFFIQYAVGSRLPDESALYLAGANPEDLLENKFTRSFGFFPQSWGGFGTDVNHFQAGGGLNLRGYAGYLVAQENEKGEIIPVYKGNSGVAINAELDLDRLIPCRPRFTKDWLRINLYLFGDAGIINYNQPDSKLRLADIRADAGVGTAVTIKKWGRLDKVKPFTLRFDMPLFLNRPPATEGEYFKFRWVLGINRAF